MAGWDDLGRVLAGGVRTDDAYNRGASKAAQLEGLIAQARIKKSEADAIANMPGALVKLNAPADLATVLAAGYDPTKLSGYTGDMQLQDIRSRALDAPDWNTRNELLAVLEGKPVQLAKVEGQNLLSNVFQEGGGGITTTEQGRASIAANAARARASDASAASSYASADSTRRRAAIAENQFALQRAGQWNPSGAGGGGAAGGAGGGGAAKQSSDELKASFAGQAMAQDARAFAAAFLGKTIADVEAMSPEDIRAEVAKGGRMMAGPIMGRIPGAGALFNADLEAYSNSAAGKQARINNPSGPVSNADFDVARRSVFSSDKPAAVNADLLYQALTRGMPSATPAQPELPAAAPGTRRRFNPATGRLE